MKSWRRQWGSLTMIGLAAVALVAVLVTRGKVTTSEREARADNVLSAYRPADLSRIVITRGKERIVLERPVGQDAEDAAWKIVEPLQEEAEIFAIDQLLGSLEFARAVRRIKPEEVDRERFGLSTPALVLELSMGEIQYKLELGGDAAQPVGARYLELHAKGAPGSGVMIITRDLATEIGVELSALRGRQLVPYFSSALARMTLERSGEKLGFRQREDGIWRLDGSHGDARVNRAAFDVVLVQLARIKAEEFLPVEKAVAALGPNAVKLTLIPKDTKVATGVLELGGSCPGSEASAVAVRRSPEPIAACIPSSVLEPLMTPAERLVDRGLFRARQDEVESVRVELGDARLTLNRKEDGFALEHPNRAAVELQTGNRFLTQLVGVEGRLVSEPVLRKLGLAPPAGKITLKVLLDEAKATDEIIELGTRAKDGSLHVRRVQDGAVLAVAQEGARPLSASAVLLRSPSVLSFAPSDLRAVELTGRGPTQRFVRHPAGQFELEVPKGYDHDGASCALVVDTLASLTADRWVADRDDGSFGFGPLALNVRIELDTKAGESKHHLIIGGLVPGGAYAKLGDAPGVFVLPRASLEPLQTLLIDRSVFMVPPPLTDEITLEREGKRITLLRQGETFVESSGFGLSTTTLLRLVETLASLRAEAAVHLGPARPNEGLSAPVLTVETRGVAGAPSRRYRIGAGDSWQNIAVHYARAEGVDATYVLGRSKVSQLLDVF